jgi:hypothetical protein
MTKQLKILLILIMIVIAFFVARHGVRLAGRETLLREAVLAGRAFRDAGNFQRHEMRFSVEDINDFLTYLGGFEALYKDSLRVLQRNFSGNTLTYLAEVRSGAFYQFLFDIRLFEATEFKREQSTSVADISVDLSERIAAFEDRRQRLIATMPDIENISRRNEAENQLIVVQTELDSLRKIVLEHEHYSNNSLLFLVVGQAQSGITNMVNFSVRFALRFLIVLIVLTVLLIALIFMIDLVLRIMSWLGIHTSTGRGGRYGSYKYGSYKYGNRRYGGGQRKVKRIYKDGS